MSGLIDSEGPRLTLCSLNFPIPRKLFFNIHPEPACERKAEFLSGVGGHHSWSL